ncbi:related to Cap-associated protein CAF20 [Saccharomycodes ludwigii]|uniref:Cap-associated protein CAF20 n=1 Tax=Saccharomycodes ludwigii TaxID=36035 RepID=A0A376B9E8_9ASCO|nr:hypothetical protein SCDLUD_002215 [Saccharomycodes ludwigii]KAH3902394.1 hypothetical protein SCDLUD_002215 [Saccharomycodes ludwigii]SSD61296.1 related to Cap-associated protein CAF20 [Saccharomycodes ludwigii]
MSIIRYTEEELLTLKPSAVIPTGFDHQEFSRLVAKVTEILALRAEEYERQHPNGSFNRRRSSHHHVRPKIHKNKPKILTDSDGWSTLENNVGGERRKSSIVADDVVKSKVRENIVNETVKIKPNNKNIGSSRPADTRDIIADKQTITFNAFSALESDDEED